MENMLEALKRYLEETPKEEIIMGLYRSGITPNAKLLKEALGNPDASKEFLDFIKSEKLNKKIIKNQFKRFHLKFNDENKFSEFVEKVLKKYHSEAYIIRWYKRGIETQQQLCWFLFNYAKIYGRKCKSQELKKYGNCFVTEMRFIGGYYFMNMDGQGSVINIIKQSK